MTKEQIVKELEAIGSRLSEVANQYGQLVAPDGGRPGWYGSERDEAYEFIRDAMAATNCAKEKLQGKAYV